MLDAVLLCNGQQGAAGLSRTVALDAGEGVSGGGSAIRKGRRAHDGDGQRDLGHKLVNLRDEVPKVMGEVGRSALVTLAHSGILARHAVDRSYRCLGAAGLFVVHRLRRIRWRRRRGWSAGARRPAGTGGSRRSASLGTGGARRPGRPAGAPRRVR